VNRSRLLIDIAYRNFLWYSSRAGEARATSAGVGNKLLPSAFVALYPLHTHTYLENAMAPFIPVPNTVEAHLRGTLNGEPVENTLYFHKSGSWDITAMGILNAALALWYRTSIVGSMSEEYQYRESYMVDLTTADGLVHIDNTDAGMLGTVPSDASSNQAAFCVRFSTGRRGRSYRGRNYVPAVPESNVNEGRVLVAYADFIVDAYNILNSYDGLFGAQWVVVSRFALGLPREYGISTPVIGAGYSTLALASQRGRRPA